MGKRSVFRKMEKKKYNITVGNETKEFEEGTTYQAVAKEFCGSFSHPAVLAVCRN